MRQGCNRVQEWTEDGSLLDGEKEGEVEEERGALQQREVEEKVQGRD